MRELRGALRGAVDLHDLVAKLLVVKPVEKQRAVAAHARQDVVEVVGNSSGQTPDCLDLLGLPKLLFQPLFLSDIGCEHHPRRPSIELEVVRDDRHPYLRPVLFLVRPNPGIDTTSVGIFYRLVQRTYFVLRSDVLNRHLHKLVPRIPIGVDGGSVDGEEAEGCRVVNPHWDWVAVEELTVTLLGELQGPLHANS